MLTAVYEEPTGDWIWRFRGAGTRCRRDDLARAAAIDGPVEPFEFELRFRGLSAVWDLKKEVVGQVWTNAHWEQPCSTTGWVTFGGQRHEFTGTGIRDHSRGSRDFVYMGPHFWLHGQFPSGKAFGLLHIDPTSAQPRLLSSAYVAVDGELRDAKIVSLPTDRTFREPFEIVIETDKGPQRIRGELLHDMTFTVEYPNEILFGYRAGKPQHQLNEGQVRWTWDGETGYGLGERTEVRGADGSPERR
jgi:hypothetical protein